MAPPPGLTPISAPDLTGPTSFLDWPVALAGPSRGRKPRPFAHVHLEIDLRHERLEEPSVPLLLQFERLLREREVVVPADLLRLSAAALHACSERGFARVDHWEIEPGGWLPLPEPTHASLAEPLSHLVRALSSPEWRRFAAAREFSVRMSGPQSYRADLRVRRIHRERIHSMTIDLRGTITPLDVERLVRALRERLPVLRSAVTEYAYADAMPGRRARPARGR
ncbi:MAG TPA: hypothetical protein VMC82_03110 [Thermoplasmata archaeon]|nr:hypothetical protein [Thermoplasmata archaeon]